MQAPSCSSAPPLPLHPPPALKHTEGHKLFERNRGEAELHKGGARFLHRPLTNRLLCCAPCRSPVTWQHRHGNGGLSNHLCNDPYSPEGRQRTGGAEGGGGRNESRASKSREREGGGEDEGGRRGGREKQQDPDRKKENGKQIFFLLKAEGKLYGLFL